MPSDQSAEQKRQAEARQRLEVAAARSCGRMARITARASV